VLEGAASGVVEGAVSGVVEGVGVAASADICLTVATLEICWQLAPKVRVSMLPKSRSVFLVNF